YYVGIGKAEALLSVKDTIQGEHLKTGDTVRGIIDAVNPASKGPSIVLSRTSTNFLVELFKMEVPEISGNIVIIKDVVREPGERTKIAVFSKDQSIDPVGACVGMKGTRVQTIVRELRGERIDIINWSADPRVYIARALTPADVDKIGINEEDKTAMVVVDDSQLSVAIGKKGQNVKLAMKLTGWDIDIISETRYSKIRQEKSLDDLFQEKVRDNARESAKGLPKEPAKGATTVVAKGATRAPARDPAEGSATTPGKESTKESELHEKQGSVGKFPGKEGGTKK
ncbi:MAG: transcription termination factor NusA, partial [Nitrospirae bacterium]|nr:transcription termination factor NusA [Nitrospirota bacterium]